MAEQEPKKAPQVGPAEVELQVRVLQMPAQQQAIRREP